MKKTLNIQTTYRLFFCLKKATSKSPFYVLVTSMLFLIFSIDSTKVNAQCNLTSTLTYSTPNNQLIVPFCTPITLKFEVCPTNNQNSQVDIIFSYDYETFSIIDAGVFQSCTGLGGPTTSYYCLNNQNLNAANGCVEYQIVIQCINQSLLSGSYKVGAVAYQSGTFNACTNGSKLISPTSTTILGNSNTTTTITQIPNNAQTILISGDVIFDLDHTINATTSVPGFIAILENRKITIKNGRTLTLLGADVFGCLNLYNTIEVEANAYLHISKNQTKFPKIQDAIKGITPLNNSNINITNCIFEDNQMGLYFQPTYGTPQSISMGNFAGCEFRGTGKMKPLLGQGVTPLNQYPYTGIEFNDLSYVTLSYSNSSVGPRFKNMNNGILANRTGLFVNRNRFENIKYDYGYGSPGGNGIYVNGISSWLLAAGEHDVANPEYKNCSVGIAYQNIGAYQLAQINNTAMDNTGDDIGIGVNVVANTDPEAYIYVMDIKGKVGIRSFWTRPYIGEIYGNTITANYPNTPSVSYGIYAQEYSSTGQWTIYDNLIGLQNAITGIKYNSGTGATIRTNIVDMETYAPTNSNGFYSGGSSNLNVFENDFRVISPSFADRSAMYMVNTTGSTYRCNTTTNTKNGINFLGDCRPVTLRGNKINQHNYGLVLNNNSFIGLQSFQGNRWNGPFSAVGAQHFDPNLQNILASRFETSTASSPIFPTNNASGWFSVLSGTDYSCPNGMMMAAGGNNSSSYYRAANSPEPLKTDYPNEMKWTLERNAYGRLKDNSSEANGDIEATNFSNRMVGSSIAQLYSIEKGFRDAQDISKAYEVVLKNNMAAIKKLVIEIDDLERKIDDTKGAEQEAYKKLKKENATTIYQLSLESAKYQNDIELKKADKIKSLIIENENINARLIPEINEKEVNRIYLSTVAQGKTILSKEQKAMAKNIAFQCPLQGGNAVFVARSLYSLVEDVNFDDLALCSLKNAPLVRNTINQSNNYSVSPNPASNIITVSRVIQVDEVGEWTIQDISGKILITQKATTDKQSISIQGLNEGIYFVSYAVNNKVQFTSKIVKLKSN